MLLFGDTLKIKSDLIYSSQRRCCVSISRCHTVRTFDILKSNEEREEKKLTKIFRVCFCLLLFGVDILLCVRRLSSGATFVVVEGERELEKKEGKKVFHKTDEEIEPEKKIC